MNKTIRILCFLIFLFILMPWQAFSAQDRLHVLVSVLPQKYFAERVGGDRVLVDVLVKPGKSPATYAPTPAQIRQLMASKVYFRVGVPFENGLMEKIKSLSPETRIIDTRDGVPLRDMREHHDHHDDEHHGENNDTLGKDPHIWMNPLLVKTQAQTIYKTLCDLDPQGRKMYTANLDRFLIDLETLNDRLSHILKDFKGENVFVFHPSFGYFTDAYGLNQVAIETMGKAPKGKELARIIRSIKEKQGRVIFVQPQFDTHSAQKMAQAVNGSVIPIDPLAYDYLENMISIGDAIATGLGKQ